MLKRNEWTRGRIALREWLPVIVLMCCTFVFNTSEFIPIGLLSDIAADFGITEARAGLLITGCWDFSLRATCCRDFRLPMRC